MLLNLLRKPAALKVYSMHQYGENTTWRAVYRIVTEKGFCDLAFFYLVKVASAIQY